MARLRSAKARASGEQSARATRRRGLAATLLEPACLEAIALVEAGLRGVRRALVRLRGGATMPDDAADVVPPAHQGDQVGPAPCVRAPRDTHDGEPPRVVGGKRPHGGTAGDSDLADVAHGALSAAEHGPEGARELPALLARGDALANAHGDDRVVLIARDPFCLFAYWDLAPSRWRPVESATGSDRVRGILRVSDVTQIPFTGGGTVRHRDLEIADPVGSSYVWIETPGRSYVAEVGYMSGDGTFVPLARSNLTWSPRAERPGTDPIRWMTVRWTGRPERTYPPIGAAPTVRRAALPARAVSSFDAEARAPASDEHADWHAPRTGGARRRTEPAPTNGRE